MRTLTQRQDDNQNLCENGGTLTAFRAAEKQQFSPDARIKNPRSNRNIRTLLPVIILRAPTPKGARLGPGF
jgi:hypothetical protein